MLADLVEQTLNQSNVALASIDGIFVIIGPGSFTGLRVGVATTQAYSYALDIPVVGVSSLFALACGLRLANTSVDIALQASPKDFFVSQFGFDEHSRLSACGELRLEDGEPPQHYFESGISAPAYSLDWSAIIEEVRRKDDKNSAHLIRARKGLGLSVLYGKGSSAKTLEERGLKPID